MVEKIDYPDCAACGDTGEWTHDLILDQPQIIFSGPCPWCTKGEERFNELCLLQQSGSTDLGEQSRSEDSASLEVPSASDARAKTKGGVA